MHDILASLREELQQLRQINNALREEMREVRRENQVLQQKLAEAYGHRAHDPYQLSEAPALSLPVPAPKRPLEATEDSAPISPTAVKAVDADGDLDLSPGGQPPDLKRGRAPEASSSGPYGL